MIPLGQNYLTFPNQSVNLKLSRLIQTEFNKLNCIHFETTTEIYIIMGQIIQTISTNF